MKAILSMLAGLALAGCASVPGDAPEELKSANQAIKHAKDVDAEKEMPKTVKGAEKKLDGAVSMFKDSKDKKNDDAARADLVQQSIVEAKEAQTMAENATAVHDDVLTWDQDPSGFIAMRDDAKALGTARSEIARLRSTKTTEDTAGTGPVFDFAQPVAYFDTAQASLKDAVTPQLDSLVKMLNENSSVKINLIGYADHRGPAAYNETLSENRADAVAKYLEAHGVSADRIKIEYRGAQDAMVTSDNPAKLQLDRRVDASFNAVAH